ncbi:MAG: hypothetical protein KAR39_05220 [Thermoplasmata archaeon]|nr:hypothetical protein [Thermoplasmata archaeon]
MPVRRDALKELGLEEATIVSLDIPQKDKTRRSLIHRYIHGRIETRSANGETKTYTYSGLLDEGGFRVGQSVYLLPSNLASRLILKLSELNISHRYWDMLMYR